MRKFQKIGRAIRRASSRSSPVSFTCRGHPICRDKLFEYTNGRFLINEGDALRRRYLKFDIDELCAIASNVGSKSPVHAVEKMEGGFSKALLMKKMDGTEVVAKLPFTIAGPPKYTTAAEVAVLQYGMMTVGIRDRPPADASVIVHQHTKVPVPKVLAWSSDSSNLVGAEYIIMEKAAGTQLVKKWHEMKDQSHFLLIKNLCALEAELASIPFPVNGALYLRESMTDGEDHTLLDSNVDPSGRFCVGPSCERAWDITEVDREHKGPWHGLPAFGHAIVQRELSRIMKSQNTPAATYIQQKGTTEDQTSILNLAREIITRMDAKTLPGKYSRPALWHTDLHFGNIYVSNEDPTNIVSLIDWQGIVIAPLLYQVRFPEFLDVSEDYIVGGPIPQLPENLDQMDSDDQDLAKFEHKQACMAKAYEAASGFKDREIYWALQTPSYFKELFVRAGEVWEEGVIPLRACLIEISKGWREARFVGQCPISFSTEQIDKHEVDFQAYSNFHSVQEIARKYLDTDTEGWLPPSEDLAQKHKQNKELLQLVMDTSTKYGMSPKDVKRIWSF